MGHPSKEVGVLEREDRELIESRKRGLRHLDVAVWLFPLLWLGTVAWTWFRFPLLNNPWALHESLSRKGALSRQALRVHWPPWRRS